VSFRMWPDVVSGGYYTWCALSQPSPDARDEAVAARLWSHTEEVLAHAGG
jgi:hypothetical protein